VEGRPASSSPGQSRRSAATPWIRISGISIPHDLEELGVQIWTSSRVAEITAEGVHLGAEFVGAKTVIWAAGVQPSSLSRALGVALDKQGRVIVESDLSLSGNPDIFVIGDQACFRTSSGNALAGLAPVAMQEGRHAAENIRRTLLGLPSLAFRYQDKGMLATIGRKRAVVQMPRLQFGGFTAWLTWLFVHIFYLIGFKDRAFVLAQWAWSYATFRRGARLIVEKEWRSSPTGHTFPT